jgi:phage tail sheath protein FI
VLPQPEQRPDFDEDQVLELQSELVRHCETLRDRFAVLDAYPPDADLQRVVEWRRKFTSKFAALYYPWIRVADSGGPTGSVRAVPPSGHVAGVYSRVSLDAGVHKPPAGEVVEGAKDVVRFVGDADHGVLNDEGVNVIKPYDGRGIRVVGARTVSSDADWQFVNVRRLVIMIEETIDEQLQWAVFEPHGTTLRRDVDRVIRSLLTNLWQQGMLDGATADEAFGVTCDDSTNTQHDVDQGRMVCHIVLNVPWPAEFVVVRIGIGDGGIRFVEGSGGNA